jgi:type I restriction enzyme, S subunit
MRLGDVTTPTTASKSGCAGLRYLGLENVEADTTRVLGTTSADELRSPAKPFEPGDVLYARLRPYLNKVCAPDFGGLASSEFLVFKRRSWLEPKFLKYALNAPQFVQFANSLNQGVGRPRVRWEQIARYEFPLPPLAEQRRIAAALEEQLSRLDVAVATLRAVRMRSALARRAILADGFARFRSKVPLVELTDPQRPICYGILKPRATGDLVVPYVEVRSIREDRIDLAALHRTTLALHREFARSTLRHGDVVIAVRGSWDRAAVVPAELEGANVSRDVARIAPLPWVAPKFLSYFLASPAAAAYFASAARGVGVRGVNIGDLRRLPVPAPAPDEQAAAVERIEAGLSAVALVAESATLGARRADRLRSSILAAAFRGELVPQNPEDEPASVLLERIAAERASAPKTARKRRDRAKA